MKLNQIALIHIAAFALAACGTNTEIKTIDSASAGISDAADIAAIVSEENDYRLGLGQTLLSPGLSCSLYTFTSGDRIQASVAGHNTLTGLTSVGTYLYKGPFDQPAAPNTDGMNVLPPQFRSIYQNLYLIRCQGYIVVRSSDYYAFEYTSDDAGVFYLDGSKVIDVDNAHAPLLGIGQKYLRRGVHQFRLDYAQSGAGTEQLTLTSSGTSIESALYYH